jgi:hypothetical protein
MRALMKKEWRLSMSPVPFFFLALSALLLIPSYPYYVTFFYTSLGIFLFFQAARENRDVYYMMLLPVGKREMVRARVYTVVMLECLQALVCVPFALIRASYAGMNNPVGIEANAAFFGLSFVLLGVFNLVFLTLHYKNGYDLGKPFLISSIAEFVLIVLFEALDHVLPYMKTVCESCAPADLVRQLPVLFGGLVVYAALTLLACRRSEAEFERVDL